MTVRPSVLFLALAAAVCAVPVAAAAGQAPAEVPSIVTRGTGVVTRAPELARLRVSAIARSDRSDDAGKKSAEAMTAVRRRLQEAGIPDPAVTTTGFIVQPEFVYQNNEQKFRGFMASNSILVRVDDVSKVAPIVDAVIGVNLATVESLEFDVRDRKAATQEALRLAVADAMSKAGAMATGAGKTAGEILKLQEDGVTFPEPFNLRMNRLATSMTETVAVAAAAPVPAVPMIASPITPGPIEITARVVAMIAVR